jgi:hypothetical protein
MILIYLNLRWYSTEQFKQDIDFFLSIDVGTWRHLACRCFYTGILHIVLVSLPSHFTILPLADLSMYIRQFLIVLTSGCKNAFLNSLLRSSRMRHTKGTGFAHMQ